MKKDVLRYLGYKNQYIDKELDLLIDEIILEMINLVDLRYTYDKFRLYKEDESINIMGSNLKLKGKNIEKYLKDSNNCILLAITLGIKIDRKINYYEKLDMVKALILDASATAYIEKMANDICLKIEREIQNKYLLKRFSPGYGDFTMEIQKDFLNILDGERKIGLIVSKDNILFPRKSITAIIGIVDEQSCSNIGCKQCDNYKDCRYKKR